MGERHTGAWPYLTYPHCLVLVLKDFLHLGWLLALDSMFLCPCKLGLAGLRLCRPLVHPEYEQHCPSTKYRAPEPQHLGAM